MRIKLRKEVYLLYIWPKHQVTQIEHITYVQGRSWWSQLKISNRGLVDGWKEGWETSGICGLVLSLPGCLPLTGKDRIISFLSSLQETPVFFFTIAHSLTPLVSESHLKASQNPKSHQNFILVLQILFQLLPNKLLYQDQENNQKGLEPGNSWIQTSKAKCYIS